MRFFSLLLILLYVSPSLMAQEDRHSTTMQDAWLSCTASVNPNPARGVGHWILYDFKDVYALNESTFWNFNTPTRLNHYRNMSWSLNLLQGSLDDGLKDIFVDISLDGITWQEWGRFTLPKANGSGFYEGAAGPNFNGKIARYVLITARNNHGGTCYGLGEVRFKATPATVSSTENEDKIKTLISISPNPAKDIIAIGLESFPNGEVQYSIIDISGKMYKQGTWLVGGEMAQFTLPVHELTNGVYILQARSNDLITSVKFEVIH